MPELPDVDGFRRIVRRHALGAPIVDVDVRNPTVLGNVTPAELRHQLTGQIVTATSRHGKWLFIATGGPTLVIHFGMTGSLHWETQLHPTTFDRVMCCFGAGSLTYSDRRNLGTIAVAETPDDVRRITGPLGPDALTIGASELGTVLLASRRGIKATLLDQTVIAGLGNMLTDELLWRAGLDPSRPARTLSTSERNRLATALRDMVQRAARAGHIPRGELWLSGQRGRPDPICPRCRHSLDHRHVAGRTALVCAHCQHLGEHHPTGNVVAEA